MKSYLAISCLVLVLVLAFAADTDAKRVRRSVNFTPSWGKRSGNFEKPGMILERGDKCMDKAAYMSMLIETLKVTRNYFVNENSGVKIFFVGGNGNFWGLLKLDNLSPTRTFTHTHKLKINSLPCRAKKG